MKTFIKQKLFRLTHQILIGAIFVFLVLVSTSIAQNNNSKDCKKCEKSKKKTYSTKQNDNTNRNSNKYSFRTSSVQNNRNIFQPAGKINGNVEKSIAVHPEKIYVQVCVTEGRVKINGWGRNEVRAFIDGGDELGIRIREKSGQNQKPVWVELLGYDPNKRYDPKNKTEKLYSNCLSGDTIELDVPQYADVKVTVRSGQTTIEDLKSAMVDVIDGDIQLNNVKNKTDAHSHQGSVTVRNSGGRVSVTTTTGNIVAYNTNSNEIGDYFKAKTRSGAVTLQSIGQKEVDASSVSGTLNYVGEILDYGRYGFSTTNGLINLIVPSKSSFRLTATYGGAFQSELPLSDLDKNRTDSIVFLRARVGEGNANVNLNSYNGTIRIEKQNVKLAKQFRFQNNSLPKLFLVTQKQN